MRPFKFFFALSLGIILFLFFAKVVIMALIAAAFMSLIFVVLRRIKQFFLRLSWEDDHERFDDRGDYYLPDWKDDLFTDTPSKGKIYLANHRTIIVQ